MIRDYRIAAALRKLPGSRLWLPPAVAAVLAALMALLAWQVGFEFEGDLPIDVDESTLTTLFSIFASGMLSVATFTVGAIVAATSSVSSSTTPRATTIVLKDNKSQLVLSSFIAAFIYSIVGILALKALHYGKLGRLMLFLGLIAIVVVVLVAFIQWVDHVRRIGLQQTTLRKIKDSAVATATPDIAGTFGAQRWDGTIPGAALAVHPTTIGYLTEIDVGALQQIADRHDLRIIIAMRPGEMIEPTRPIAYVQGALAEPDPIRTAVVKALTWSEFRDLSHDFRLNLILLAETADRALSPGINDGGTAITVLPLLLSALSTWAKNAEQSAKDDCRFPRVSIAPLAAADLVEDAFTPIARGGAGLIEVGVRLQKVLGALKRLGHGELAAAAEAMSLDAMRLAERALILDSDKQRLAAARQIVAAIASE